MKIRIGTRQSKLAIIQAEEVKMKLEGLDSSLNIEIVLIQTTGDKEKEADLTKIGGKGLFLKEIQEELLLGNIDIAVHSMKDVPAFTPSGTKFAAVLEREDSRDVFISKSGKSFMEMEPGSIIGTSSPRRRAQVRSIRPDLSVVPFRGNVDTRIKKVEAGEVDGTFLAMAGLNRLGMYKSGYQIMEIGKMIPAACQGIIGVESGGTNKEILDLLSKIDHRETHIMAKAERGFLEAVEGNCNTPMGASAELVDGRVMVQCFLASEDGDIVLTDKCSANVNMAYEAGGNLGRKMLSKIGEL